MASNHTSNYGLCQWVRTDKVLMDDFNADNAKIDAGIKAVDRRVDSLSAAVDGKASQTALNSLNTTVDALAQTVEQHTSALTRAGTCVFYTTSYTGTGTYGAANPCVLNFPHKPMAVFLVTSSSHMLLIRDCVSAKQTDISNNDAICSVAWKDKSVQWYGGYASAQMNSGTVSVLALLSLE